MAIPLPRNDEELYQSLSETALAQDIVQHLAKQARSALLLVSSAADEDGILLGASKLGGRPDLPRGMDWPLRSPYADAAKRAARHRSEADRLIADSRKPGSWLKPEDAERYGKELYAKAEAMGSPFPLAFFGQFNLSVLSKEEGFDKSLPAEGRLLLFYDYWEQPEEFSPEAAAGWRLVWDNTPVTGLVRAAVPGQLAAISNNEWSCIFRAAPLTAYTVLTPIPVNNKSWDAFSLDDDDMLMNTATGLAILALPMIMSATTTSWVVFRSHCKMVCNRAASWPPTASTAATWMPGIQQKAGHYYRPQPTGSWCYR